jgi:hypothetical protein
MNNADMPAIPTGLIHEDVFNSDSEFCGTVEARYVGLTKREHFAGLAMQGLCHAIDSQGTWAHDAETVAETAVRYADALLDELDKGRG